MKVRIYKPHTHAGKRYTPGPEGVEIEVREADARFLERAGVLTAPAAAADVQAEATTAAQAPAGVIPSAATPSGTGRATTTQPAAASKQQ